MVRRLLQFDLVHLERQFLVLSAMLLSLVGLLLYFSVAAVLTGQAVDAAVAEASAQNAALSPLFLADSLPSPAQIDDVLARQGGRPFVSARIWSRDGTLLYASQHDLIGRQFDLRQNPELQAALKGEVEGELSDLDKAENRPEVARGFTHLLEVYTPLRDSEGAVVGAFEVYRDGSSLVTHLRNLRTTVASFLSLGLMLVWGALYGFMRQAGNALRHDRRSRLAAEEQREATLKGALSALADAVEAKDAYTGGHIERVARYSLAIADALQVDAAERRTLEYAALLHDVGKLSVADAILLKPGPLTPAERVTMEGHAARGQQILARVPALSDVGLLVRHHHEKWDGSGYPDGLAGHAIPIGARIIAVADAYDAMTTNRPYRAARSRQEALAELERTSGSQFDPQVVAALSALPTSGASPAPVLVPRPAGAISGS